MWYMYRRTVPVTTYTVELQINYMYVHVELELILILPVSADTDINSFFSTLYFRSVAGKKPGILGTWYPS